MPLPEDVSTSAVTGSYVGFDGEPARGEVHFYPTVSQLMTESGVSVLRSTEPLVGELVDGELSISVPATDDPDLTPAGWGYRVVEKFENRVNSPVYSILAPASGVDLPTALPAAPVGELAPFVRTVNGEAPNSAGDVTLTPGDLGAQPAGDYATNTALTDGLATKADVVHAHAVADVTGLQGALDGKQAAGDYATNTDLTTGLASKSDVGHTHTIPNVTGLQAALDGKANTAHSHVVADTTGLQAALDGKQPLDADLTTIAGLTVVNDSLLQGKAGAWAVRTPAQVKTDLVLVKSDVGLGNVDNTSDTAKPVSTATQTALNLKVSKGDLVYNVKDYGAVGNGVADDTSAINNAITAAAPSKGTVYFPSGTYIVGTFTGTGVTHRAITALPGVTLRGASRESTSIKIPNGKGDYFTIIAAASASTNIDGFTLRDLTFDHNIQNNAVANSSTMVSGLNYRAALVAYVGSRVVVDSCRFTNLDCVWQVTAYGNDNVITNNLFDGFGVSQGFHDSSTIYTYGQRTQVANNNFSGTTGQYGSFCAIETHGGGLNVSENVINGFFNGMNITGIAPSTIGVSVTQNIITDCSTGVTMWSNAPANTSGWGLEDVTISDNVIRVDYDAWVGVANTHAGVMLDLTSNLGVRGIKISDNLIRFKSFSSVPTSQDFRNAGIGFYRATSPTGLTDENIEITGNQITGPPGPGIYLQPKAAVKMLTVAENRIVNPATGGGAAFDSSYRTGIKISQSQDSFNGLYLRDNVVVDNRATGVVTSGVDVQHISVAVTDGQATDNVLAVTDAASTAVDFKPSATASAAFRVRSLGAAIGATPNLGYYIGPQGTRTTIVAAQSVEYAEPVYLAQGGVLSRIGCEITAGAASSTVRLGVRADKGGLPGTLLLDAGTVDGTAVTASGIEITGLSLRLKPGLYWFTATAQGGAPTLRAQSGDGWPSAAPSLASAVGATSSTGYITAATVTGALPSTYTVSTRSGAPPRVVALIS